MKVWLLNQWDRLLEKLWLIPSLFVLGGGVLAFVTLALGVVFSLTILAVSQTVSQYGPRLLRSFIDSSWTQATLGIFVGTVTFSVSALRAIRDPGEEAGVFTPQLTIITEELLSGVCLFTLLLFTSYVSRSIRAETLIQRVYHDLVAAIERLFPHTADSEAKAAEEVDSPWLSADNFEGVLAAAYH